MAIKYCADFEFPKEFGFTGSAKGPDAPRAHPARMSDEYGDGLAKGGRPKAPAHKAAGGALRKMAEGGQMAPPMAPPQYPPQAMPGVPAPRPQGAVVPTEHAVDAARGAFMLGALHGANAAGRAPRPQARIAMPPAPPPAVPPAMAKGGKFIEKAVRHPGRMKRLAAEHGRSVHDEMEHDKHTSDPSLRSAANLGLRLTGGDLTSRKRKG